MIDLINAYNATEYKVYYPAIVIKIGIGNQVLNDLLISFNVSTWAYITAFNPFSKILTNTENLKRHEELKVKVRDYKFYEGEGEGVGEDKAWEPETSLLVLGISLIDAIEIGKFYEQNAIVVGEISGVPELKMLV
jgi:hypothetical protein